MRHNMVVIAALQAKIDSGN
ncbi:uncharacterized protein G2W53_016267 [Senna tora]|uniref:Uncharacterized protein n=1 Tax=Senna tora TaxID=362788 RepID=A0A834TMG6_9FABA|nr:uncharacterized protein G2W53_016267 [Senna tora]